MFVVAVLAYPALLALLCLGAGLGVDRLCGGRLPGPVLAVVGAATLIAVSQLTTYIAALAPATPYVLAGVALAGLVLGRQRWPAPRRLADADVAGPLIVSVAAFALVLAPVLLAGRPSLTDYGVLTDSAVHMIGADYLITHGQSFSHLDLGNSYGAYLQSYFGSAYPSGADTLFGGSAFLLHASLLWTFQPFNATILALAGGPAWLLARRLRLSGALAVLAALTATVPALVYGYELVASVKEIAAAALMLGLGALAVSFASWQARRWTDSIPLALLVAAGLSALGLAFAAWALAPLIVVAAIVVAARGDARGLRARSGHLTLVGALVVLLAALPTWSHAAASLQVTTAIATTSNAGNLPQPLGVMQALGTWLTGRYIDIPQGALLFLTYFVIFMTVLAALLGVVHLMRTAARQYLAWFALTLAVLAGVRLLGTAWANAKTLMLSSPALMLLAWGGVAALRAQLGRVPAVLLAVLLSAGVLASDALQYHGGDLAPTARYQELATVEARYGGRGPALYTDFDEWSLYVLRRVDISGPNFLTASSAVLALAGGHGNPVYLNQASPRLLRRFPLIITRRNPSSPPPPAAYRLVWQGTYYQVWERPRHRPVALMHVARSRFGTLPCTRVRQAVRLARRRGGELVEALPAQVVHVKLQNARRRRAWVYDGNLLTMNGAGSVSARVKLPHAGVWEVWVRGEIMRTVVVSVDHRVVERITDQVAGSLLSPNTMTPAFVRLSAGRHEITLSRGGATLAPGDGGSGVISGVFFSAAHDGRRPLLHVALSQWHSLCKGQIEWLEVVRRGASRPLS